MGEKGGPYQWRNLRGFLRSTTKTLSMTASSLHAVKTTHHRPVALSPYECSGDLENGPHDTTIRGQRPRQPPTAFSVSATDRGPSFRPSLHVPRRVRADEGV